MFSFGRISFRFLFEVLSDESFLGETGSAFQHQQHAFKPIMIEGGTVKAYTKWERVPFNQAESEVLGRGEYGRVTKEAIAPYQFKP